MVFFFVDVHRLSQEKLDTTKRSGGWLLLSWTNEKFYNCETVKSFLLRLNETLERVSASLARKFIDMLNNFLVSSGVLKHGEYITNIKEALEMGIPERVKRMREEIATEDATKATAEATATTALKKTRNL